jgi:hypothetical protein
MSPTRFEIKKQLQDIVYREFRNTVNKTPKNFIDTLKKQGVIVEPVRNKQNKIYGIRFQYEGQTFKASEIGKEFGLHSLFAHYGQNISNKQAEPKHFEKQLIVQQQQSTAIENTVLAVGGLLDLSPTSDYDADEAALQRQTRLKKKKQRRLGM